MTETSIFDMTIPQLERYHHKEPLTVGKMNQAVDTLNRMTRGIRPPRQVRNDKLNKKTDKQDGSLFPLFVAVLDFQNISPQEINLWTRDVHSIPTGEDAISFKWVVTPFNDEQAIGIRRQVLIHPPLKYENYIPYVLNNDELEVGADVPTSSVFSVSRITMVNQFNNFSVGKVLVLSPVLG